MGARKRVSPLPTFPEVSQNALNLAFTNNAAEPADRVVANGFAVTAETVGTLCPFLETEKDDDNVLSEPAKKNDWLSMTFS